MPLSEQLPGARSCSFVAGNHVDSTYRPPRDARFDIAHESAIDGLRSPDGTPLPTYMALGNHDVNVLDHCAIPGYPRVETERARACLEVANRSDHWLMPGRHYVIDTDVARFVILDSNVIASAYGGFELEEEIAFTRDAVEGCAGRACFVVAHHPPVSAGDSGPPSAEQQPRWERLHEAVRGKVSAWLDGHEHDMQHLRFTNGPDVFISGNTSRGKEERFRDSVPGASLLYGTTAWGFASVEVWEDGAWGVRFEGVQGRTLHCCRSASALSACELQVCRDRQ